MTEKIVDINSNFVGYLLSSFLIFVIQNILVDKNAMPCPFDAAEIKQIVTNQVKPS